ncbi:hypothetical protein ACRYCC_39215 [Actinomadura scrupuli]|uniref:hypothetical protein n=1 Tax=Actinomadura scrupuli TaxID=559629 RepID=UPI003D99B152
MTYDLAVLEGDQPTGDREVTAIHGDLYDRYLDTDAMTPAPPAITRFAETLVKRWPNSGERLDDDSPWAGTPLIRGASGPLHLLRHVLQQADEASTCAAQIARGQGLVCAT